MNRACRWAVGALVLVLACDDATDVELLRIPDEALVIGQAFLDVNGNAAVDAADTPLENVSVVLAAAATAAQVIEVTTDTLGIFTIEDAPLGTYTLQLGASVLGDSLTTVSATPTLTLEYGDTLVVELGATYPTFSLAEVRAAIPDRRVFTQGIALNIRQSNGDGVLHVKEGSAYLRAIGVAPVNVAPGDSVRLLGTTAVDGGQPVLSQVTATVLRQNAVFLAPPTVTIGDADAATGGAADAALVRIDGAEIGDTATVGGHLRFWAHDGPDSLRVILRDFLQISPTPAIRPDTTVRLAGLTGLLVPYTDASGARWSLLPRGEFDVDTEIKFADVAIGAAFTPASPSTGDTVEIRITARNGPGAQASHTATGVRVDGPLPNGLAFVSASSTRGSYDDASGIWSVGDLAPAAPADTLTIRAEVTASPGNVPYAFEHLGLEREVEVNPGNDTASGNLTVQ